uniref:B box-type domain-containing protein n=1 Tax=Mola mola TaxID=94237 RepID=A0A3Q3VZU1_MOLML
MLTVYFPYLVPPKPLPPPPHPTVSQMPRKIRLRGTHCGQCQVKTAGLVRAECCEYDCIGCFTKFHHKGALKVHRMILATLLSVPVSFRLCFSFTDTFNQEQVSVFATLGVLAVNQEEKKVEMIEEGLKRADEKGFPNTLLIGEYDEEESVRVFQEALRQWRGEKKGQHMLEVLETKLKKPDCDGLNIVEFTENSLTYMDRLFLKKHQEESHYKGLLVIEKRSFLNIQGHFILEYTQMPGFLISFIKKTDYFHLFCLLCSILALHLQ